MQLLWLVLEKLGFERWAVKFEEGSAQQKRLGNLVVRTHAAAAAQQQQQQYQQPECPANTALGLSSWTNCVRTTQYTWWSFLPLNLLSQITQPANFYFLIMALLQTLPQISDSDGMPTFLFPLGLVMVITAAKDGYENLSRARADRMENARRCSVCTPQGLTTVAWADLTPGSIVKLSADEAVPADLVLLNCADPCGVAYVDSVQLDGETNLKNKMCIPNIAALVQNDADAARLKCVSVFGGPAYPSICWCCHRCFLLLQLQLLLFASPLEFMHSVRVVTSSLAIRHRLVFLSLLCVLLVVVAFLCFLPLHSWSSFFSYLLLCSCHFTSFCLCLRGYPPM